MANTTSTDSARQATEEAQRESAAQAQRESAAQAQRESAAQALRETSREKALEAKVGAEATDKSAAASLGSSAAKSGEWKQATSDGKRVVDDAQTAVALGRQQQQSTKENFSNLIQKPFNEVNQKPTSPVGNPNLSDSDLRSVLTSLASPENTSNSREIANKLLTSLPNDFHGNQGAISDAVKLMQQLSAEVGERLTATNDAAKLMQQLSGVGENQTAIANKLLTSLPNDFPGNQMAISAAVKLMDQLSAEVGERLTANADVAKLVQQLSAEAGENPLSIANKLMTSLPNDFPGNQTAVSDAVKSMQQLSAEVGVRLTAHIGAANLMQQLSAEVGENQTAIANKLLAALPNDFPGNQTAISEAVKSMQQLSAEAAERLTASADVVKIVQQLSAGVGENPNSIANKLMTSLPSDFLGNQTRISEAVMSMQQLSAEVSERLTASADVAKIVQQLSAGVGENPNSIANKLMTSLPSDFLGNQTRIAEAVMSMQQLSAEAAGRLTASADAAKIVQQLSAEFGENQTASINKLLDSLPNGFLGNQTQITDAVKSIQELAAGVEERVKAQVDVAKWLQQLSDEVRGNQTAVSNKLLDSLPNDFLANQARISDAVKSMQQLSTEVGERLTVAPEAAASIQLRAAEFGERLTGDIDASKFRQLFPTESGERLAAASEAAASMQLRAAELGERLTGDIDASKFRQLFPAEFGERLAAASEAVRSRLLQADEVRERQTVAPEAAASMQLRAAELGERLTGDIDASKFRQLFPAEAGERLVAASEAVRSMQLQRSEVGERLTSVVDAGRSMLQQAAEVNERVTAFVDAAKSMLGQSAEFAERLTGDIDASTFRQLFPAEAGERLVAASEAARSMQLQRSEVGERLTAVVDAGRSMLQQAAEVKERLTANVVSSKYMQRLPAEIAERLTGDVDASKLRQLLPAEAGERLAAASEAARSMQLQRSEVGDRLTSVVDAGRSMLQQAAEVNERLTAFVEAAWSTEGQPAGLAERLTAFDDAAKALQGQPAELEGRLTAVVDAAALMQRFGAELEERLTGNPEAAASMQLRAAEFGEGLTANIDPSKFTQVQRAEVKESAMAAVDAAKSMLETLSLTRSNNATSLNREDQLMRSMKASTGNLEAAPAIDSAALRPDNIARDRLNDVTGNWANQTVRTVDIKENVTATYEDPTRSVFRPVREEWYSTGDTMNADLFLNVKGDNSIEDESGGDYVGQLSVGYNAVDYRTQGGEAKEAEFRLDGVTAVNKSTGEVKDATSEFELTENNELKLKDGSYLELSDGKYANEWEMTADITLERAVIGNGPIAPVTGNSVRGEWQPDHVVRDVKFQMAINPGEAQQHKINGQTLDVKSRIGETTARIGAPIAGPGEKDRVVPHLNYAGGRRGEGIHADTDFDLRVDAVGRGTTGAAGDTVLQLTNAHVAYDYVVKNNANIPDVIEEGTHNVNTRYEWSESLSVEDQQRIDEIFTLDTATGTVTQNIEVDKNDPYYQNIDLKIDATVILDSGEPGATTTLTYAMNKPSFDVIGTGAEGSIAQEWTTYTDEAQSVIENPGLKPILGDGVTLSVETADGVKNILLNEETVTKLDTTTAAKYDEFVQNTAMLEQAGYSPERAAAIADGYRLNMASAALPGFADAQGNNVPSMMETFLPRDADGNINPEDLEAYRTIQAYVTDEAIEEVFGQNITGAELASAMTESYYSDDGAMAKNLAEAGISRHANTEEGIELYNNTLSAFTGLVGRVDMTEATKVASFEAQRAVSETQEGFLGKLEDMYTQVVDYFSATGGIDKNSAVFQETVDNYAMYLASTDLLAEGDSIDAKLDVLIEQEAQKRGYSTETISEMGDDELRSLNDTVIDIAFENAGLAVDQSKDRLTEIKSASDIKANVYQQIAHGVASAIADGVDPTSGFKAKDDYLGLGKAIADGVSYSLRADGWKAQTKQQDMRHALGNASAAGAGLGLLCGQDSLRGLLNSEKPAEQVAGAVMVLSSFASLENGTKRIGELLSESGAAKSAAAHNDGIVLTAKDGIYMASAAKPLEDTKPVYQREVVNEKALKEEMIQRLADEGAIKGTDYGSLSAAEQRAVRDAVNSEKPARQAALDKEFDNKLEELKKAADAKLAVLGDKAFDNGKIAKGVMLAENYVQVGDKIFYKEVDPQHNLSLLDVQDNLQKGNKIEVKLTPQEVVDFKNNNHALGSEYKHAGTTKEVDKDGNIVSKNTDSITVTRDLQAQVNNARFEVELAGQKVHVTAEEYLELERNSALLDGKPDPTIKVVQGTGPLSNWSRFTAEIGIQQAGQGIEAFRMLGSINGAGSALDTLSEGGRLVAKGTNHMFSAFGRFASEVVPIVDLALGIKDTVDIFHNPDSDSVQKALSIAQVTAAAAEAGLGLTVMTGYLSGAACLGPIGWAAAGVTGLLMVTSMLYNKYDADRDLHNDMKGMANLLTGENAYNANIMTGDNVEYREGQYSTTGHSAYYSSATGQLVVYENATTEDLTAAFINAYRHGAPWAVSMRGLTTSSRVDDEIDDYTAHQIDKKKDEVAERDRQAEIAAKGFDKDDLPPESRSAVSYVDNAKNSENADEKKVSLNLAREIVDNQVSFLLREVALAEASISTAPAGQVEQQIADYGRRRSELEAALAVRRYVDGQLPTIG